MRLPEDVTEPRPLYLHVLRSERVLLILDNALDGDPGGAAADVEDCALIVTPRRRIAVGSVVCGLTSTLAPEEAGGLAGRDRGRWPGVRRRSCHAVRNCAVCCH
jgi:hypothetical protein